MKIIIDIEVNSRNVLKQELEVDDADLEDCTETERESVIDGLVVEEVMRHVEWDWVEVVASPA
jgi:hypothetical protein